MAKLQWFFFFVWIICLISFIAGQSLAPPEYSLIQGNPWGMLFGVTFILGVISFLILIILVTISSFRKKGKPKTQNKQIHKYDLSFKRIASRVMLTGVIGIFFGIAMFPFLTVADGLLYEQRAAIGGQNMIRMVALWGLFTLVVLLFTFWKKRFRMVSVLLFCCWVISIGFVAIFNMYDANNYRCRRSSSYTLPSEFTRSLDLISQRIGIDTQTANNTIWQSVFNYRNCLDIQYSNINEKETEAYFQIPSLKNQANLQDLKIMINPSYKNFDDLTLATLLSHELVHAGQFINEVISKTTLSCYEQEAKAYTAQQAFIRSLNQEEQRSIYTRLQDNIELNPTFKITLLTEQFAFESGQACLELQKKNNLTDAQTNQCSWEGLESKLLQTVKEDPYYQKQCK